MNKHAFLIIAHKNDLTFNTLIKLLDHPNNDIFIHMDKKLENYNPKLIEAQIKYSNIYHVLRTDVRWGGYSQINAELLLLKKANNVNKYVHYHLLSGEDLPIKKWKKYIVFLKRIQEKISCDLKVQTFNMIIELDTIISSKILWDVGIN